MQAERLGLRNRIEKKAAYLQELEEQAWIAVIIFLLFVSHDYHGIIILQSWYHLTCLNWLLCKIFFAFVLLLANYF